MAGRGGGKFAIIFFFFLILNAAFLFWMYGSSSFRSNRYEKTYKVKDFFGTIASGEAMKGENQADKLDINNNSATGSVITVGEEESVNAKIKLNSAATVMGVISFNPELYSVSSVNFINEENRSEVVVRKNSITIANTGDNEFFMILKKKKDTAENINFKLSDPSGIIIEQELKTTK